MKHLFFIINFVLALFSLYASFYCLIEPETPFSFLGGIILFVPSVVFAVKEWLAWYRKRQDILHTLAMICFFLGGFTVFGVVANVAEALTDDSPIDLGFFGWFIAIGLSIACYFFYCGIYRLRSIRTAKCQPQDPDDTNSSPEYD